MAEESRWRLELSHYDPDDERRREALFALGNGAVCTRGAAPEARADGRHYPGTYRAGLYDRRATEIRGEEVEIETIVNLPNWLPVQVRLAEGPWLSLDAVAIDAYRHALDLETGTTVREAVLRDGQGRRTRVCETRLVSMARPAVMALRLVLTPLDWSGRVEIASRLDADVANTNVARDAPYPDRLLAPPDFPELDEGVMLRTGLRGLPTVIAQAQRTTLSGARALRRRRECGARWVGEALTAEAGQGVPLGLEKVVAMATSADRPRAEPARMAAQALGAAPDFESLLEAHGCAWRRLWDRVGLEAEAEEMERPLRLHAFHILQAVSPNSVDLDVGLPARGWTGEAYQGHVFWDELFVFPFLTARFPELARAVLLYRYRRLDAARAAARAAGYRGAMYPWRSASDGGEVTPRFQFNLVSGRWMPDHTNLQRHVGAAIAWNVWQYLLATEDTEFLAEAGAEMLIEIARFWASRAEHDPRDGRYHIRGVVGPDEYHNAYPEAARPGLDDNAYTNVMAVWTLCRACEVLDHLPAAARRTLEARLQLAPEELAEWDRISRRMHVAFLDGGIIGQFAGFERLEDLGPEVIPEELRDARVDWALEAVGASADAYKITKQADVLTLFHLLPVREVTALLERLGYSFGPEELRRTAEYYLARTAHRSSLSRIVYAGALADIAPATSWRFFREALDTDLGALKGESIGEGVHLGAMGGTLDVLQRRYLGLSLCPAGVRLTPRLPPGLGGVCLRLRIRGLELHAEAGEDGVTLSSAAENARALAVEDGTATHELRPGASVRVRARDGSGALPLAEAASARA